MKRQCGRNNTDLYDKILTENLTKERIGINKNLYEFHSQVLFTCGIYRELMPNWAVTLPLTLPT